MIVVLDCGCEIVSRGWKQEMRLCQVHKQCYQCGIESGTLRCECGLPICRDCLATDACGTIYCVACGGPINQDWDTVFDDEGGGIHASCR